MIRIDQNLVLRKMDLSNSSIRMLVDKLDVDDVIGQYLFPISTYSLTSDYLINNDKYDVPYIIIDNDKAIGMIYLDEPNSCENGFAVHLTYIIEKNERRKGYASRTLLGIEKNVFNDENYDIAEISLVIDATNENSIKLAEYLDYNLTATMEGTSNNKRRQPIYSKYNSYN